MDAGLNPRLTQIPGSLIRAVNARKRPGDVDLGLGEPVIPPPAAPFEAAAAWVAQHGCPYSPNAGFLELREAIAHRYALPGLDQAANVCVTVGSQEAIALWLGAHAAPGAELLLVGPAYPAYAKLAALWGLAVREVLLPAATGFKPEARVVLDAIGPQTALVILASPGNPTGRVWPPEELQALAQGLAKAPGGPPALLLDAVYRELDASGHPPADRVLAEAGCPRLWVANSLSKSHALTGLRLGWLLGPAQPMAEVVKLHQFLTTAAGTPAQRTALAVFTDPSPLSVQAEHYQKAREALHHALKEHGIPHAPSEGAFYTMVPLPTAWDDLATALHLVETQGVVTIPGQAFGAPGWLRLSAVAEPELLREGVRRLAAGLKATTPPSGAP